jgi:hypothetical protein
MSTAETAQATPKSQRRRRASTGGFKQKLDAPTRKGYVRRWVDNDPSRIMAMEELGYALVADKAGEDENRTEGMGTRIARHGGKRDNGQAQQLVLMECRAEDYAMGEREKEDQLKPFEDAIRAGQSTTGPIQDGYEPANRSTIAHERERA